MTEVFFLLTYDTLKGKASASAPQNPNFPSILSMVPMRKGKKKSQEKIKGTQPQPSENTP